MQLLRPSFPVVLASASPRRRELLARIVADFTVDVANIDEEAHTLADPVATAEQLALKKSLAIFERDQTSLVIGGDTVVALGDAQFAKPTDAVDAIRMLEALSAQAHRVISGVAVVWPGGQKVFSDVATVIFRRLTAAEIEAYVATGEPMDKAGGYAIQGGAARFVERLDGDIDTVIGLPVSRLRAVLEAL